MRGSEEKSGVIEVSGVSKRFTVQKARAGDLRERFAALRSGETADRDFWALRDVSFTVARGESVGIVGHNGSGKSTLLKLLTRILTPTTGRVCLEGRVGALIEVGAGFHPDLTGRENVYLSGSILGLSRREISERYERIVGFAGLEQFMDTPVKRYSSGMYMRLGFAVAAHTDPDILLIDEVLAVGDMQFQNRCLRFLGEFQKRGGTVVFVSHAMNQVAEICQRCIWLDYGQVRYIGPASEAIDQYLEVVAEREEAEFKRLFPAEWEAREAEKAARQAQIAREEARQQELLTTEAEAAADSEEARRSKRRQERLADPQRPRLLSLTLRDSGGTPRDRFHAGESIQAEIRYQFQEPLPNPAFCVEVFREDGLHMFTTSNYDHDLPLQNLPLAGQVRFDIPFLSLNEGRYTFRLRLYRDWQTDDWDEALVDEVEHAAKITVAAGRFAHGCAYLPVRWEVGESVAPRPRLQPAALVGGRG